MSKMKYSGVKWIGDIPETWIVKKIKYVYNIQTGFTPDTTREEYYSLEEKNIWVSIADLTSIEGKYIENSSNYISNLYIKEKHPKMVKKGSLLYSFKLSVGKTAFAGKDLYTNEAIAAFAYRDNVCLKYLNYATFLIEHNSNKNIYNALILNQELIKNSITIIPPLYEQKLIANFLDEKVLYLDEILSDLNKEIEILNNYKISLILEKVTKGLNENVELKESGIDWIGRVPSHWKIKRIKDCNRLQTGTTPKDSIGIEYEKTENNYHWYTPGDYINKNYILDKSERVIDKQAIKDNNIRLYPENTILLVGIGATVGKIAFIKEKAYANQQITAIIPSEINYKYELYYLISKSSYIKDNALYTTLPILNNQYLGGIKIIFPPLEEQKDIVDYLDKKCEQIDKIIEEKQKQIEKIEEYKKSVIYEYVTGKKRVEGAEELYG